MRYTTFKQNGSYIKFIIIIIFLLQKNQLLIWFRRQKIFAAFQAYCAAMLSTLNHPRSLSNTFQSISMRFEFHSFSFRFTKDSSYNKHIWKAFESIISLQSKRTPENASENENGIAKRQKRHQPDGKLMGSGYA